MKRFLLGQITIIRRVAWAKREAKPFLAPGRYILYDNNKKIKPTKKHIGYRIFTVKNTNGTGNQVLFATNGQDMRIVDTKQSRIITVTKTLKRAELLLHNRKLNFFVKTPKILSVFNDHVFSEEFIESDPVSFVNEKMFSNFLHQYYQFYKSNNESTQPLQHNDLHRLNILWKDNRPIALIDLEDANQNWFLYDVMTLLVHEAATDQRWLLLDAFFNGNFDKEFSLICEIFGEEFSDNQKVKFLKKYLKMRYNEKDFESTPHIKENCERMLARYENFYKNQNLKHCIFSVSNEPYAEHACAALCSAQDIDPTADLFLAGTNFSQEIIDKLLIKNVHYINIKGTEISISSDYNKESYYYVLMPEILLKKGYKKSLYIDADVVAIDDFSEGFEQNKAISGVAFQGTTYSEVLKKRLPVLKENFDLKMDLQRSRIHAGVLFFDHQKCHELEFQSKILDLMKFISKTFQDNVRDNELFTIFQAICGEEFFAYLPTNFNYIDYLSKETSLSYPRPIFYHFTYKTPKPWKRPHKKRMLWYLSTPKHFLAYLRFRRFSKRFNDFNI